MIRSIRRPAAVAAALATVVGLAAGCGGTRPAAAPPTVAYLAASLSAPYSVQVANGFRAGVAEVPGVRLTVAGPSLDNDPITQVAEFHSLLGRAAGGISVSMTVPERFTDDLADAAARRIPVIAVDIPPPAGTGVDLYVGNDSRELGRQLADLVLDELPPTARGSVLLGNPRPGVPVLDLRAAAVRAEFHRRRPDLELLGPFDTDVRPDANLRAWRQLLAGTPRPVAALSVGADGAVLAKAKRLVHGRWPAAAFDLDAGSLAAARRGELLLVSPEHFLKGAIAGRLQAEHAARHRPLPVGWIYTAGLAVTSRNADAIIRREASAAARAAWFGPALDTAFAHGGPVARPMSQVS